MQTNFDPNSDANNVGWDGPLSELELVCAHDGEAPTIEQILSWFGEIFALLKMPVDGKFQSFALKEGDLPWVFDGNGITYKPGRKHWNLEIAWGKTPQDLNTARIVETLWQTAETNNLNPQLVMFGLDTDFFINDETYQSGEFKTDKFLESHWARYWILANGQLHKEKYADALDLRKEASAPSPSRDTAKPDPNKDIWDGPASTLEITCAHGGKAPTAEQALEWFKETFEYLRIPTDVRFSSADICYGQLPWSIGSSGNIHFKPGRRYWSMSICWGKSPYEEMDQEALVQSVWQIAVDKNLDPVFVNFEWDAIYILDEDALDSGAYKARLNDGFSKHR